jgi:hypothetical protein
MPAIGDIAGNIHELAFLFTGRTLLRRSVFLDNIPAVGTFPFAHIPLSFPAGGASFQNKIIVGNYCREKFCSHPVFPDGRKVSL